MQAKRHGMAARLRALLSMFLTISLVTSTIPHVPAFAQSVDESSISEFEAATLAGSWVAGDGTIFDVEVSYGDNATAYFPSGGELIVGSPDAASSPWNKDELAATIAEASAGKSRLSATIAYDTGVEYDVAFDSSGVTACDAHFLDLAIEVDGQAIQPQCPLEVTITTDAFDVNDAPYVYVFRLDTDGFSADEPSQPRVERSTADSFQLSDQSLAWQLVDELAFSQNDDTTNAGVTYTFTAEQLGVFALVSGADDAADVNPELQGSPATEGDSSSTGDASRPGDESVLIDGDQELIDAKALDPYADITTLPADDDPTDEGLAQNPADQHSTDESAYTDSTPADQHVIDLVDGSDDSPASSDAAELTSSDSSSPRAYAKKLAAAPAAATLAATQSEDANATPVPTSPIFTIRATASGYSRATTVTFVDTDQSPIDGTVIGTITRSLTVSGPEQTDENSLDMYAFANKLDPAIADEYEFSRVYLHLNGGKGDQKDFRYLHVADDRAIASNGSTTTYRAYLYMNSIEENKAGQVYNGTWYNLANGGAMDPLFIEYYHVAPATFNAIDERNDPVEGAEFTLYTDSRCYTPLEYKGAVVAATSDRYGVVDFGKIPYGTYYMKETAIPASYKTSTKVRTVVVDGQTRIGDVVHEDDDGSVIVADTKEMTITKQWDDDAAAHTHDAVFVTVYEEDEEAASLTDKDFPSKSAARVAYDESAHAKTIKLDASNNWSCTLTDLDPNTSYMVSETRVLVNGQDKTSDWIPHITMTDHPVRPEYYESDVFQTGKDYVLVTQKTSGPRALGATTGASPSLVTSPLETENDMVTSEVSDDILWHVEHVTSDNVISLKNVFTQRYLDHDDVGNKKFYLADEPPLFIRHLNENGIIRIYSRANINAATSRYLYVWHDTGKLDRTSNASDAAKFTLYRKVAVKTVDVQITNNTTRYPLKIQNVAYPTGAPVPGMRFDLYEEGNATGTRHESLVAGSDGFLHEPNDEGHNQFELSAGTYLLEQTQADENYAQLTKPVRFTITRAGALRVLQADQEVPFFTYGSTYEDGDKTYPLLRVPHYKPVSVSIELEVRGAYADRTREFAYELAIPAGITEIQAKLDDEPMVFSADNASFTLTHGQTLTLLDVPASETYVLTQAPTTYETSIADATDAVATLGYSDQPDQRTIRISDIVGTTERPAHVTIANELPDTDVLPTGLDDDVRPWLLIVALSLAALLATRRPKKPNRVNLSHSGVR